MLKLLIGTDWKANRAEILNRIAQDVRAEQGRRVLMVPELISHDTERRLCAAAGDTASRFAEVLSFTRLAQRVSESAKHGLPACMDNGGRVVAMAATARQLRAELKSYAAVETKPEFLSSLVDAVDEFKRCCISPEDLRFASHETEGAFSQKLKELSLLLEGYDALCKQGKADPRDQMTWLLEELADSSFAENHIFYIDGFPDFTRQHMAILEYLIRVSPDVTVSLNCDCPGSKAIAFEKAGSTANEFIQIARRWGIESKVEFIKPANTPLIPVCRYLFQGDIQPNAQLAGHLTVGGVDTIYDEVIAAAHKIQELVQSGARYRDISVVCTDLGAYQSPLKMVFERFHIPLYLSGTEDILDKPVIQTVLAALDAALSGFQQRDVLRYLRSMLSPVSLEEYDRLENYAVIWNIKGNQWLSDWTNHPKGLSEEWRETDREVLTQLNTLRIKAMEPLERLRDAFTSAVKLKDQIVALYDFLTELKIAERLHRLAANLEDNRDAQILNQLWDILLAAMEQLYDVLGETAWESDTFTRLLRLLLSQYNVGTIPAVLDSVTAGNISAMRCQQQKHLILLGAQEGRLPGYGGATGILNDKERTALRQIGLPLTGGSLEGLQAEFAEIYGVFCGAEETITVLYSGSQPSFVYGRLATLSGQESNPDISLGLAMADETEAGAYLVRTHSARCADDLGLSDSYQKILSMTEHQLGTVDSEHIKALYGDKLTLSASQVDKQADCRLAYFLRYGIRAKERKVATIDPAEFGTYVHDVLENTARAVMEAGGFKNVSKDETVSIAKAYSRLYSQEHFQELDSNRRAYLFEKNEQELEMVVQELWEELQASSFIPVDFEVAFGADCKMPSIVIPAESIEAELRGFVDRVDAWQENGQNYFRVVDYKTGKKDFDYCDVFNGLGLQMLLYLFALEQGGEALLGDDPIPAGVQYFPARAPITPADGILSDEDAAVAREKLWKRKGLLLQDEQVLYAMEPEEKPRRLNVTRRKDGLSGDLASREQLRLLKDYVFHLLTKMVEEIMSGNIDANPYTRGTSHNPCVYCPYGAVCHSAQVEGRRNYKIMTAQRFWEEVEKEMKKNG